jgi:hypothetical protein
MRGVGRRLIHFWALALYTVVALGFNWPLPLYLNEKLPGAITGDTGVYVWNLWLFRHELVAHGRFPLFTQEVLSLSSSVDLSLHNYTVFPDVLAFPLIPAIGVTATFNVLFLALTVLTAWTMFLLARSVVRRDGEAWLAGLLFGCSPVLMARSTEHFSLASAVPLPLFVLAVRQVERDGRRRWAALSGAIAGWASLFDPYYGIFCIVIAAAYFTARHLHVESGSPAPDAVTRRAALRLVDGLIAVVLLVIAAIVWTGGTDWHLLNQTIKLRSLYNPVFALTGLLLLRTGITCRPVFTFTPVPLRTALIHVVTAAAACTVVLTPVLIAFGYSLADGATLHGPNYWRSTPGGVDLLALFTPNPNHALFGEPWRWWLASRPNRFEENVAALTFVGIGVIGVALWRYRFRPPVVWVALTIFLGALAVGPFVYVGGVNTFVPGPWALLRYVPVLTATRMPARYAIPMMMAFSVLFALALRRITTRHREHRRLILAAVAVGLVFELSPYPRTLHSAHVPDVLRIVARDPRSVRVLGLPFGYRDGEWSEGDFNASSQFFQTFHEKPLLGGYLSRISAGEMRRQREFITVRYLLRLSEGGHISTADVVELKRRAPGFVARARLGYVFVNVARTPPDLLRIATETFGLVKLGESDGFELYAPTVGTTTASR